MDMLGRRGETEEKHQEDIVLECRYEECQKIWKTTADLTADRMRTHKVLEKFRLNQGKCDNKGLQKTRELVERLGGGYMVCVDLSDHRKLGWAQRKLNREGESGGTVVSRDSWVCEALLSITGWKSPKILQDITTIKMGEERRVDAQNWT